MQYATRTDYATRDERESDSYEDLLSSVADEVRSLFEAGFAGTTSVRLPSVRTSRVLHKFLDGREDTFSDDRIVYETPFADAVSEVLDSSVVMGLLLKASEPDAVPQQMQLYRDACASAYIHEHADDIARVLWQRRQEL